MEHKMNNNLILRLQKKPYSEIKSWHRIEKAYGRDFIIKDCNFDLNIILSVIKQYVKGNLSKYKKIYKQRIKDLITVNDDDLLRKPFYEIQTQMEEDDTKKSSIVERIKEIELHHGKMMIGYFGYNIAIQVVGSDYAIRRIHRLDSGITLDMLLEANEKMEAAI